MSFGFLSALDSAGGSIERVFGIFYSFGSWLFLPFSLGRTFAVHLVCHYDISSSSSSILSVYNDTRRNASDLGNWMGKTDCEWREGNIA